MPRRTCFQLAFLALILVGLAAVQRPDGKLHIIFFETAGDAILIQTPNGATILIDGGSDPAALTGALGRRLPFWQRELDAVILTASDGKHLPGQVAALARYQVKRVIAVPFTKPNATMREWQRLVAQAGRTPTLATRDLHFQIDQVEFQVLASNEADDKGVMLRMTYGAQVIIFAHSVTRTAEAQFATQVHSKRVALLSYPWQRDPNTAFVEGLHPVATVFTDGQSEKKPAELTLPERTVAGAAYHERLHGEIEWIGDGRRATITVTHNYCSLPSAPRAMLLSPDRSISASCNNRARS